MRRSDTRNHHIQYTTPSHLLSRIDNTWDIYDLTWLLHWQLHILSCLHLVLIRTGRRIFLTYLPHTKKYTNEQQNQHLASRNLFNCCLTAPTT